MEGAWGAHHHASKAASATLACFAFLLAIGHTPKPVTPPSSPAANSKRSPPRKTLRYQTYHDGPRACSRRQLGCKLQQQHVPVGAPRRSGSTALCVRHQQCQASKRLLYLEQRKQQQQQLVAASRRTCPTNSNTQASGGKHRIGAVLLVVRWRWRAVSDRRGDDTHRLYCRDAAAHQARQIPVARLPAHGALPEPWCRGALIPWNTAGARCTQPVLAGPTPPCTCVRTRVSH